MFKVLISDNLSEEGQRILKADPEVELDAREKVSAEELLKIIPNYDALIVRSDSKVTKAVLDAGIRLKVVGRAGVGLDNVDTAEATRRGIIVMNTPDGNTISTAEHTFSMIMALARNIPQADASLRAGKWERKKFMGAELYGKTLGVIGLGRIGTEVAKRAVAFGMRIMAYDPFVSQEKAEKLGMELATVEEIIAGADFITVHTPKNKETDGLIGKAQFEKMKPGVRLINCARGGIIRQADLREALKSGKVAGAALDVFEEEPPQDKELLTLPNVVVTPHLGASTEEAQINVAIVMAEQILDVLKGRMIRNAVNIPSIPTELFKEMTPYLTLAERLSSFQAQVLDGQVKKITLKYAGDVCAFPTNLLSVAVVKGLLSSMLSDTINFVNALVLAKERGIEIVETISKESQDFTSTFAVEVETDKSVRQIVGTLIGKKREPRVVSVFGFYTDFIPEGNLLVFTHTDEPGIVGRMGTMLGDAHVNIAALHMGRNQLGGDAVSILNLDAGVPPELLAKLAQTAKIKDIKLVKL